ncbi:MAG: ADP-ribosylglycohydrolase family protein [Cyanobacteria bacterium P01_E01_bin.42]
MQYETSLSLEQAIIGCLLGTAVGDAMGLPFEGLSKHRQKKWVKDRDRYYFFFNKGMVSDDTEHACMVAQSLIVSAGHESKFTRTLAWRLRFWLLCLPAGVGFATLRSLLKLWLGFSPHQSGVFSAGNGVAMRSPIVGVCYGDNIEKLRSLVRISTRMTHSDPKAEYGAFAIAIAAYFSSRQQVDPDLYYQSLQANLDPKAVEFFALIKKACQSAIAGESAGSFARYIGCDRGISGYIYRTVPVVIQVWLRHPQNYARGIQEIIALGGDTDTTAAILGGIIGASVGKIGIPQHWQQDLWEIARSQTWIESVGKRLTIAIIEKTPNIAIPLSIPKLLLRNFFFLCLVLGHGFRRLFPPY